MIKKALIGGGVVFLFVFLFSHPKDCAAWICEDYSFFLNFLFPSLFLPMVLSGFLCRSPLRKPLGKLVSPPLSFLFGTDREESLALLFSFLCGYPTGIVLLKSLWQEKKLSTERYRQLTLFCNNCGIGFLFSFLGSLFSPAIARCLFLSQLFSCLVTARLVLRAPAVSSPPEEEKTGFSSAFLLSVKNSLSALCFLGGLFLFFSFLLRWLSALLPDFLKSWKPLLAILLELCSACTTVKQVGLPPLLCAVAMGWGGLCVWAQSRMASGEAPFPRSYLLCKGLQGLLCGLFYQLFSGILL